MNAHDSVLRAVAGANPVADPPTGTARSAQGQALLDRILHEELPPEPRLPKPHARRRILQVAVVLALAVAVTVGALNLSGDEATRSAAYAATPPLLVFHPKGQPAARALLLSLAQRAARQPPLSGSGRVGYVRTQSWYLDVAVARNGTTSVAQPVLEERWLAADGSGRMRDVRGHAQVTRVGSAESLQAVITGEDSTVDTRLGADGTSKLPPLDLAKLSLDPAVLADQILNASGPEMHPYHPGEWLPQWLIRLQNIVGLYHWQPVPPALQAALTRVLADTMPGLVNEGPVTDRVGRAGVALSTDAPSGGRPDRFILVFSPTTGALTGYERLLITKLGNGPFDKFLNVKIPAVVQYTDFLTSGRTNSDTRAPTTSLHQSG